MANTACGNVEIHKTDSHISTRIVELEFISRFIEGTETRSNTETFSRILRESPRLRACVLGLKIYGSAGPNSANLAAPIAAESGPSVDSWMRASS
jgi:hypothetical protein